MTQNFSIWNWSRQFQKYIQLRIDFDTADKVKMNLSNCTLQKELKHKPLKVIREHNLMRYFFKERFTYGFLKRIAVRQAYKMSFRRIKMMVLWTDHFSSNAVTCLTLSFKRQITSRISDKLTVHYYYITELFSYQQSYIFKSRTVQ